MSCLARRRDLAMRGFGMHPGEILTGDGDRVAVLTDATAIIRREERRWSTVGLHRFREDRVAACWQLPWDTEEFDQGWGAARG